MTNRRVVAQAQPRVCTPLHIATALHWLLREFLCFLRGGGHSGFEYAARGVRVACTSGISRTAVVDSASGRGAILRAPPRPFARELRRQRQTSTYRSGPPKSRPRRNRRGRGASSAAAALRACAGAVTRRCARPVAHDDEVRGVPGERWRPSSVRAAPLGLDGTRVAAPGCHPAIPGEAHGQIRRLLLQLIESPKRAATDDDVDRAVSRRSGRGLWLFRDAHRVISQGTASIGSRRTKLCSS